MSNFAFAQVGVHTPNPQGAFHIDGAKDNPATGIPNATQESNDLTVLSTGYVGIGTIVPKQQLHIRELNTVSAIANSYISGIAITGSGSAASGWTGPGFYLENVNAPAGSRLLKINYSMNNTEPILNFQRVTDNAGADAGGAAMVLTRSGKLGINNIYNPANNLTVNGNASVGNAYIGVAAPPNGTIVEGIVGIGTSAPASTLDVTAKNPTGATTNVDGLLIPRIDRQRAQSMASVPISTLVYINNIATGTAAGTTIDVTSTGYYYFNGTKWTAILSSANNNNWQLTGNAGTDPATNFIGTTDNQNLIFKRNNIQAGFLGAGNTAFGLTSLPPTSTALFSTAFGVNALGNSTGNLGSAFGYQALGANTTGSNNSAFGTQALDANTTGVSNTAVGSAALGSVVSGGSNTAVGYLSLRDATGSFNTALGYASLINFVAGTSNIGIGQNAGNEGTGGVNFTSGDGNIIIGRQAALPNGNNQMNIGSVLFGTSINGTLAARTGNIGIKTPNPQQTFHIDGAADNPVTGAPTATQQVNDVVVTTSGNVGVGTINPLNKLHVDALTSNLGRFTLIDAPEGTAQTPILALRNTSPTATGNYSLLGFTNSGTTSGGANWGIGSIRTATNEDFFMGNSLGGNYIERFRITSTGNVGIGTNSPTSKLEISSGVTDVSGLKFTNMNNSSATTANAATLGIDASGNVVVQDMIQKARFRGTVTTTTLPANNDGSIGPFTQLSYSENFDVGDNFSVNVFTAPRTGYYSVNTHLVMNNSSNWALAKNELYLDIQVNGVTNIANTNIFSTAAATSNEAPSVSINGLIQMNAGQQLTVRAWMFNNGVARTIQNARTSLSIWEL